MIADGEVELAVPVEVADDQRGMARKASFERVADEVARRHLLQEHDGRHRLGVHRVRLDRPGNKRDHENVEIAIPIEVAGQCDAGPGHVRKPVVLELYVSQVLQPLNAVPGAEVHIVEKTRRRWYRGCRSSHPRQIGQPDAVGTVVRSRARHSVWRWNFPLP